MTIAMCLTHKLLKLYWDGVVSLRNEPQERTQVLYKQKSHLLGWGRFIYLYFVPLIVHSWTFKFKYHQV